MTTKKSKNNKNTFDYLDLNQDQLIYYDFETTGLNIFHDRIIEYAFYKENNLEDQLEVMKECHYITSLVKPNKKFEYIITKITGIHPEELESKEPIESHVSKIRDFLTIPKGTVPYLVAHNGSGFDDFFLKRILSNTPNYKELKENWRFIDTIHLAKKIARTKHLRKYSLKALAEYYGIKEGTHRALSDVTTLREVYKALINDLSKELCIPFIDVLNDPKGVYEWLYDF
jgi:DNA polymerase-3 subunit epsilon